VNSSVLISYGGTMQPFKEMKQSGGLFKMTKTDRCKEFYQFGVASALLVSVIQFGAGYDVSANFPFFQNANAPKINDFGALAAKGIISNEPQLQTFLSDHPESELKLPEFASSSGVKTIKIKQFYKGIEVLGSLAMIHENIEGKQEFQSLLASLKNSENENQVLTAVPTLKLLASADRNSSELVYWVSLEPTGGLSSISGYDVIINAHTGNIVAQIPHQLNFGFGGVGGFGAEEPAKVSVFDAKTAPETDINPDGSPRVINMSTYQPVVINNQPQSGVDESSTRGYTNAARTLQYYLYVHKRNGFDGYAANSNNVVHMGRGFRNAFWHSQLKIMAYGDGDGRILSDFTKSVDVAGHEMTHGVISSTSGLLYFGESGALNEAYADFFGEMIEAKQDWVMGRDLFLNPEMGKNGVRNIANPNALVIQKLGRPYPKHMAEKFNVGPDETCNRLNDNCWVHVNSTIPSHASFLIYNAIGKERAQKLLYVTMTQFLTARDGFSQARDATLRACGLMYDAETCGQVAGAYQQVGL
jgi:Zn-dependent metalloprotease